MSHCINAIPRDMWGQRSGRELQPVRSLALEEGGWSVSRCGRFTLGKGPSPILHEAGCACRKGGTHNQRKEDEGFKDKHKHNRSILLLGTEVLKMWIVLHTWAVWLPKMEELCRMSRNEFEKKWCFHTTLSSVEE